MLQTRYYMVKLSENNNDGAAGNDRFKKDNNGLA
jgi:hypothetical protein